MRTRIPSISFILSLTITILLAHPIQVVNAAAGLQVVDDNPLSPFYLVKDINTTETDPAGARPSHLINVNETLYFLADDGIHGRELWKSNGFEGGTMIVKDFVPGESDLLRKGLTNLNGILYLLEYGNGVRLWRSDGTLDGTYVFKELDDSTLAFPPESLDMISIGSSFYFVWEKELWKSNGTPEETELVYEFEHPVHGLDKVGNTLLMVIDDPAGPNRLWKSNGTTQGTAVLADMNTTIYGRRITIGELHYFFVYESDFGLELWQTDGTASGTHMVKDMPFRWLDNNLSNITNVNGTLFFHTVEDNDEGCYSYEQKYTLWKSDGTDAGTVAIKEINLLAGMRNFRNRAVLGETFFFTSHDGRFGSTLWKSDGTEQGTMIVKNTYNNRDGKAISNLISTGELLIFIASDQSGQPVLWKSDGTTAGTFPLSEIYPSMNELVPENLQVIGNTLFFAATDDAHGTELWAYPMDFDSDQDGIRDLQNNSFYLPFITTESGQH